MSTISKSDAPDIYDGAAWTEMDIEDLKAVIEDGTSIGDGGSIPCR
jgi:hypothetical protein